MIRGIGTDIIEVKRIEQAIQRHGSRFLDRLFSEQEQFYCNRHKDSARHYAGRFAAKEAIVKALGTGFRDGVSWLDLTILNDNNGKPTVTLSEKLRQDFNFSEISDIQISISHCKEYATAFAIVS